MTTKPTSQNGKLGDKAGYKTHVWISKGYLWSLKNHHHLRLLIIHNRCITVVNVQVDNRDENYDLLFDSLLSLDEPQPNHLVHKLLDFVLETTSVEAAVSCIVPGLFLLAGVSEPFAVADPRAAIACSSACANSAPLSLSSNSIFPLSFFCSRRSSTTASFRGTPSARDA